MSNSEKKSFKVIILGDGSVGKTSIRHRYLGQGFRNKYSMTIGADFAVKRVKDKTIQIWDLAGQSRFSSVREVYYQGSAGAILVFDVTRKKTFQSVPKWLKELLTNNNDKLIPIILVGNKIDMRTSSNPNGVTKEQGIKYAQSLSNWAGFEIPYVETSAKTNINVKAIFDKLIEKMLT